MERPPLPKHIAEYGQKYLSDVSNQMLYKTMSNILLHLRSYLPGLAPIYLHQALSHITHEIRDRIEGGNR